MLFSIVKDPVTSVNALDQDFKTINHWAHQWKLESNPGPTKQTIELIRGYLLLIIGMTKHLPKYLPVKILILMYKSLVRTHFDYCDIIFHISQSINGAFDVNAVNVSLCKHMVKIESVQSQAALAITGTSQGTSRF